MAHLSSPVTPSFVDQMPWIWACWASNGQVHQMPTPPAFLSRHCCGKNQGVKPSPPTDTGRQQCVRYWNRWQSGYIVSFKTYLICIYLYIVVILLYYVILVYCSYINLSWIGGPIFGRQLGTFLPEPSPSCNLTACHAFNHRFSERYPGVYSYKMWKTQESRGKRSSLQEDKSSTNRHVFLVGGWASPLKNLSSSVGIIIPNIRGNNKCSKPPTR